VKHHHFEEEHFLERFRKDSKQTRRAARSKDRSKFKKTDWQKYLKKTELDKTQKISTKELLRGRVLSIKSQDIVVECENKLFHCVLRGLLKKEKGLVKNLITVGDFVLFEKTSETEGAIAQVEPRKSVLSRADKLSQRKEQLIAANIDQVLITVSLVTPPLKPFLVDRYIIAARKGGMDPILVVNKIDLIDIDDEQKTLFEEMLNAYPKTGIPVIPVSVEKKQGLDRLRDAMHNKASVFAGQSGVGKSSLINAITGLNLPVGDIVEKTRKGAHTTTRAHLVPLEFGGWCIDTPGIKSFGVWDLKKDEVEQYFPDIYECGHQCKFPDCTHSHEMGCAVLHAVEKGEISQLRYDSYQYLMESVSEKHRRR
jgi:ribosome biogenesis GTPase